MVKKKKKLLDKKNKVAIFLQLAPNLFAELEVWMIRDTMCPTQMTNWNNITANTFKSFSLTLIRMNQSGKGALL